MPGRIAVGRGGATSKTLASLPQAARHARAGRPTRPTPPLCSVVRWRGRREGRGGQAGAARRRRVRVRVILVGRRPPMADQPDADVGRKPRAGLGPSSTSSAPAYMPACFARLWSTQSRAADRGAGQAGRRTAAARPRWPPPARAVCIGAHRRAARARGRGPPAGLRAQARAVCAYPRPSLDTPPRGWGCQQVFAGRFLGMPYIYVQEGGRVEQGAHGAVASRCRQGVKEGERAENRRRSRPGRDGLLQRPHRRRHRQTHTLRPDWEAGRFTAGRTAAAQTEK